MRATQASALAVAAFALVAAQAFADTIPAGGGTISASGGWSTTTGLPDSCDSTEWLFIINGLSDNASSSYPSSISVVFDNSLLVDVPATGVFSFVNPTSTTVKYSIVADATNSQYTLDGATATFAASSDGHAISYNNFVLSHGPCASSSTTPPPPPPPPPPPGATPELDSLLLFGSGLSGVGGYALMKLRARRKVQG